MAHLGAFIAKTCSHRVYVALNSCYCSNTNDSIKEKKCNNVLDFDLLLHLFGHVSKCLEPLSRCQPCMVPTVMI